MGDDDRREGPSLELPSFRLGRRRRARPAEAGGRDDAAATSTTMPGTAEPPPDPQPRPEATRADEPETQRGPAPQPEPEPPVERPLVVEEASPAPLPRSPLASEAPVAPVASVASEADADRAAEATAARQQTQTVPRRAARRRPQLGGLPAAVLTGVVVGLLTVALTWASQRGCEALRGTSTCGGGPGFLLLVAIMVAMVLLGGGLLRVLGLPAPGSTSFLGMGLLAVITLLFFVGVVFDWWMTIVIPVCAGLTYALSHWVTATYAEPER